MFRLLIVGKTEDAAKEAARWAVSEENKGNFYEKQYEISGLAMSIRVYPLWIDQKARKPAGDGLLLVARTPGDLQAMETFIEAYKGMPIKFILYDGTPIEPSFEAKWDAKPLSKGPPMEFVEKLITTNNEIVKRVAKVFKSFDTSGTGKIDTSKLKSVAEELMNEFQNDIYATNTENLEAIKAGLSNLEDVMEWWKSGGLENPSQVGTMIKSIIDENPIVQIIIQSLKQIKIPSQSDKMVEGKFSAHANKVEAPGIGIHFAVKSCGNSLDTNFQEYANSVGIGNYDPFIGIAFRSPNPEEAVMELRNLLDSVVMLGKSMSAEVNDLMTFIDFKYGTTNDKVLLCVVPSDKGATAIDPIISLLNSFSHIIVSDQFITIDINLACDLEKLATEERPFYDILLDGITMNMNYKVNPEINRYLNHMQASSGALNFLPKTIRKSLASSLFVTDLIKSADGELEFEVTQDVKEAVNELIDEEAKVPLKFLKDNMADEVREKTEEIPLVGMAHSFFKDNVTGIEIFNYFIGLVGIKLTIALPGLSSMLTF
jgi:hypothetical protein